MQYTRCTPRMHSDSNNAAHGSHPECTLFQTTQNTRCTPRTHTVSKPEHMEQKATTVELRTKYRPSSPCLAWKRQMKKRVREPRPEGTGETQSPSVHKHHSSTIPLWRMGLNVLVSKQESTTAVTGRSLPNKWLLIRRWQRVAHTALIMVSNFDWKISTVNQSWNLKLSSDYLFKCKLWLLYECVKVSYRFTIIFH